MSGSINNMNHKCDTQNLTGPVTITAGKDYNKEQTALMLPTQTESTTLLENGTTLNNTASSIYFHGNTDGGRIRFFSNSDGPEYINGSTGSYLEIATGDNANEPIYVRQYTNTIDKLFGTLKRTLTLLGTTGETRIPGTLYIYDSATGKNINVTVTLKNIAGTNIVYE